MFPFVSRSKSLHKRLNEALTKRPAVNRFFTIFGCVSVVFAGQCSKHCFNFVLFFSLLLLLLLLLFCAGESHSLLRGVRRPMTQGAARRIQSATAKAFGGVVPKGSFSSRAQSTADRRANWNIY